MHRHASFKMLPGWPKFRNCLQLRKTHQTLRFYKLQLQYTSCNAVQSPDAVTLVERGSDIGLRVKFPGAVFPVLASAATAEGTALYALSARGVLYQLTLPQALPSQPLLAGLRVSALS